ncbi:hypothetical protein B0H13DRAFT_1912329 [Mycena leptocephala]|nr:hypothetical protein B0H13DRAFT_1912329 [Mycena leptocephala]
MGKREIYGSEREFDGLVKFEWWERCVDNFLAEVTEFCSSQGTRWIGSYVRTPRGGLQNDTPTPGLSAERELFEDEGYTRTGAVSDSARGRRLINTSTRASADGLRRTTKIQEGKIKSIAVGCRKMGYIVKTSSIYRKLASRKEAVLWYHMVTENGSSSLNGVAELERIGEEEEKRRRTEKEEEEESNRGNSTVNGKLYPNSVSAADRTPSLLGQLRCVNFCNV